VRLRSDELEILDDPEVPDALAQQAYRELTQFHRRLGNTGFLIDALRRDPLPVHRVLDIGCAAGGVLRDIVKELAVEAIGVDLAPRDPSILKLDAIREELPRVDVAFALYLAHHLSDTDLAGLIRNVGRSSRRFILLDIVRHPLPLALFRLLVAPFSSPVVVSDGLVSFRRAYTGAELAAVTADALQGSSATFCHSVTRFRSRQVIDITY
jgi:SAM-dependent methyltransferase